MDGLTPGRMVHYVTPDADRYLYGKTSGTLPAGIHCAAIVTDGIREEDGNPVVNLTVFQGVAGLAYWIDVPYSETAEPHTWHWIERA